MAAVFFGIEGRKIGACDTGEHPVLHFDHCHRAVHLAQHGGRLEPDIACTHDDGAFCTGLDLALERIGVAPVADRVHAAEIGARA